MKKPLLINVFGPTASGKTKVAIQLAQWLDTVILSCDSRQFFRELKIGAAPPSTKELTQAEHRFIHNLSIEDDYNAGIFERDAISELNSIFKTKKTALMVGGSGLYANAVLYGFDDLPKANPEIREVLNAILKIEGIEPLQKELAENDPEYFKAIDKENPHRLIRALEVIRQTGKPMSDQQKAKKKQRIFDHISFVMDLPRVVLYDRINQRVDVMMANGLEEEARKLLPFREKQTLNTVGYKELFQYFDGEYDVNRAVELIKQNSRRFAKRQLTWLRRDKDAIWVNPNNIEEMKAIIQVNLETK